MITTEQVAAVAGAVLDPVLGQPLSAFKAIKQIAVDGDTVAVTVTPGYPVKSVADQLQSSVRNALIEAGAKTALVTVTGDIASAPCTANTQDARQCEKHYCCQFR